MAEPITKESLMDIIDSATLKTRQNLWRFESRRDIRDKVQYATIDAAGFELDCTPKEDADLPTFAEYVSNKVKELLR